MSSSKGRPTFVQNAGQWDARAAFLAQSPGANIWITKSGFVMDFLKTRVDAGKLGSPSSHITFYQKGHVVGMQFANGSRSVAVGGDNVLVNRTNYIGHYGKVHAKSFSQTTMRGIYPNTDARVYFDGMYVRYDLIVKPGASPSRIALKFEGANSLRVRDDNTLMLGTSLGEIPMSGLSVYQTVGATRHKVPARFQLENGLVKFAVGAYDHSRALIIDPLVYGTLLGGSNDSPVDNAADIVSQAVSDGQGFVYATGATASVSFPTTFGAYQETPAGVDAFLTKFLQDGTDVVFSTRIGGAGSDGGSSLAVDANGAAYIGGSTTSAPSAFAPASVPITLVGNPANLGAGDAFVCKITPDGKSMSWATFIFGSGKDSLVSVGLDKAGNVYYGGSTTSPDLATSGGAFQSTYKGGIDAFVGSLSPTGSSRYLTYVGGSLEDDGAGLAVNPNTGQTYLLTTTASSDFPFTAGAYNSTLQNQSGITDAAVSEFDTNGTLVASTALGGNNTETGAGIAIDALGNVYVTGTTFSFNFPRTPGVVGPTFNLTSQGFISKLDPTLSKLVYSTFIPASENVIPTAIAVDSLNGAYVVGGAFDNSLPKPGGDYIYGQDPNATAGSASADAFLYVVDATASNALFGSYYGSKQLDAALSVAVNQNLQVIVSGYTRTFYDPTSNPPPAEFPHTANAFKPRKAFNDLDGFVLKLTVRPPITVTGFTVTSDGSLPNGEALGGVTPVTGTITINQAAPLGGVDVTVTTVDPTTADHNENFISAGPIGTTSGLVHIDAGQTTKSFVFGTTRNGLTKQTNIGLVANLLDSSQSASITLDPYLQSFTVNPTTANAGDPITGTVTLYAPAPVGGLVVSLGSTPAAGFLSSNVTVPSGATTVTFGILTSQSAVDQSFLFTATYEQASATATLTLSKTVAPVVQTFTIDPSSLVGSPTAQATATITLDKAAFSGGLDVTIHSGDPAVANAVGADSNGNLVVHFAGGQQTATVAINAPNFEADAPEAVTFTATTSTSTQSATLTVIPISLLSITLDPGQIRGGPDANQVTLTVNLGSVAPAGGATITLDCSDFRALGVPSSIQIPAGATSYSIAVPTGYVSRDIAVTVTATYHGTSQQAVVVISR